MELNIQYEEYFKDYHKSLNILLKEYNISKEIKLLKPVSFIYMFIGIIFYIVFLKTLSVIYILLSIYFLYFSVYNIDHYFKIIKSIIQKKHAYQEDIYDIKYCIQYFRFKNKKNFMNSLDSLILISDLKITQESKNFLHNQYVLIIFSILIAIMVNLLTTAYPFKEYSDVYISSVVSILFFLFFIYRYYAENKKFSTSKNIQFKYFLLNMQYLLKTPNSKIEDMP